MMISLCCNDPRDGSLLGKSENIEILHGDVSIEFEGRSMVTRIRKDGALQLGRFAVPIRGYRTWVGNWCWDAAVVELWQGFRVANILLQAGWQITAGPVELSDDKPITREMWSRIFQKPKGGE